MTQHVCTPYKDRLILFIDILGFEALVNKSRTDTTGALIQQLHKILSGLNEGRFLQTDYLNMKVPQKDYEAVITAFSDLIVISVPATEPYAVHWLLSVAFYISQELMECGMLCRGGIDFGQLHHTQQQIFGPAMNDAYGLEQSEPGYPRILFSNTAVALLEKVKTDTGKSLDEFVAFDTTDGKKYLDLVQPLYLEAIALDWRIAPFDKCLMKGPESTKADIVEKYEWLRDKCTTKAREELEKKLPAGITFDMLVAKPDIYCSAFSRSNACRMLLDAWVRWSAASWPKA